MNKNITKGKKFLITGGAGFLGSHMCDLLLAKGAKIVCVDDLSNGKLDNIKHLKNEKRFKFYKRNANVLLEIKKVFSKEKPDYIMHYAAMVGVKRTSERPLEVFQDIEGIKNIAELARQYKVKKILFTSSSEVYGEPVKLPIAEDDTFNSKWPYGLVKILGEQYFQAYYEKYGIPVTILRYFNVYGPRQDFGDSGFVVSVFLKRALEKKPLEILGTGEQTRDFVYVEDNVRLSLKALLNNKVNGRPMNIGSGKSISIVELANEVKKIIPQATIVSKPIRRRGEIKYRTPDVSFMKKMLRDEPKIKLKNGLSMTLEYFKNGEEFL
ncbi:MAG: NAD-dependent epimerase/dehydratase family protein [bacterium]|nr:NAD-dependent epimerase/dehydratase family protein [bacterium]